MDTLPYNQGIPGPAAANKSPILWNQPGRHQYDRGPSEFDHEHRFVASYGYDLSKLTKYNSVARTIAGGW